MSEPRFIPLPGFVEYTIEEMQQRARRYCVEISRRRTVRDFSDRPIPPGVIEDCLRAAVSAPSGANMQPWHFCVIEDADIKRRIRVAAEEEERHFYQHRASPEWLAALAPLGTDSDKPFLEVAPCLIAVFVQRWGYLPDGRKVKHYYPTESVGLACGLLIAGLHHAGLATLTHTPSPMGFLNQILKRPKNERPFLLLVTGYPAKDAKVPDIERLPLQQTVSWHRPGG
ncbi:MAG: nitroreductase family protein [Gammaproteobacteria bacterium]|nr:nitroreductase family protein [Gammaproteobacteria bacterium]